MLTVACCIVLHCAFTGSRHASAQNHNTNSQYALIIKINKNNFLKNYLVFCCAAGFWHDFLCLPLHLSSASHFIDTELSFVNMCNIYNLLLPLVGLPFIRPSIISSSKLSCRKMCPIQWCCLSCSVVHINIFKAQTSLVSICCRFVVQLIHNKLNNWSLFSEIVASLVFLHVTKTANVMFLRNMCNHVLDLNTSYFRTHEVTDLDCGHTWRLCVCNLDDEELQKMSRLSESLSLHRRNEVPNIRCSGRKCRWKGGACSEKMWSEIVCGKLCLI